jgi:hypothetical protein
VLREFEQPLGDLRGDGPGRERHQPIGAHRVRTKRAAARRTVMRRLKSLKMENSALDEQRSKLARLEADVE